MAYLVRVEQVSSLATKAQLDGLFALCGEVSTLQLYTSAADLQLQQLAPPRIAYVSFKTEDGALVAQHLVNEPFLDRNMKATRVEEIEPGLTPAEPNAGGVELKGLVELMEKKRQGVPLGMAPGALGGGIQTVVPSGVPMVNSFSKIDTTKTNVENNAPMAGVDPRKVDEVKRTVYVGNLAPNITHDALLTFFQSAGDIVHVKVTTAGQANFAFIEFASQEMANKAIQFNGTNLGDRMIAVKFSKHPHVKSKPDAAKADSAHGKLMAKLNKMQTANEAATDGEAGAAPAPAADNEGGKEDGKEGGKEGGTEGDKDDGNDESKEEEDKEAGKSRDRDRSRRGKDRDRDRDRDRSRRDRDRDRDRDRSRRRDRSRSRERRRRRDRSGSRE